ncbi:hypothetical protein SAMN04515656_104121 [Eubacterium aggregans]|uniref:Uncharacterized protein n=2 Tax=Eubacterium aggregans TaxID=81409 RepID=A0A1H3YUK9_9FIRM|nr:hypothetical protein SAMN04515656_104121 [Eubacterium aggregans]
MKMKINCVFDSIEEMQTWAKMTCGLPLGSGQPVPVATMEQTFPTEAPTVNPLPVDLAQAPAPQMPITTAAPVPPIQQVAPVTPPAAAPSITPAPTTPLTPPPVTAVAPTYTIEQFQQAMVGLIDAGRQAELQALLQSFGATYLTEVKSDQYPALAARLKEMGVTV